MRNHPLCRQWLLVFLLGLKPISDLNMKTPESTEETHGKDGKGLKTVEVE